MGERVYSNIFIPLTTLLKAARKMLHFETCCILILISCVESKIILSTRTSSCYAENTHPYLYAGTKTPYSVVRGTIRNASIPNCKAMQIWMATRHGTRYPNKDDISIMVSRLPELQRDVIGNYERHGSGELCNEDVENLKAWKIDPCINSNASKYLTEQGKNELEALGRRFRNYFPTLFQTDDSAEMKEYKFRSTNFQRTIVSMESFINGLFGRYNVPNVGIANGTFLKPYKICKSWIKEVNSPEANEEINNWLNGAKFKNLIQDVSTRLGFPNNLTLSDVWLMYKICVAEKAWYINKISPWCAAFTEEDMKLFEYEDDLYSYYHSGYGKPGSVELGCRLLRDMFDHFGSLESGNLENEPRGVFYFTHSESFETFYTSVGIAKDAAPLKASNFDEMQNRKWRNSFLVPFATNFAAIFYKCDDSFKVRFYLAERQLEYEGCDAGVCDWEYIKKIWGPIASNCKSDICQTTEP